MLQTEIYKSFIHISSFL